MITTLCLLFLSTYPLFAGQLTYSNMYSQHSIVQGIGNSSFQAQTDAESAIPHGYIRDPDNSPSIECQNDGIPMEALAWGCKNDKGENPVIMTIPIIKLELH